MSIGRSKLSFTIILSTFFISLTVLFLVINLNTYLGAILPLSFSAKPAEQHTAEPKMISGWQFFEPVTGQAFSYYSLDFVLNPIDKTLLGIGGGTSGVLNYFRKDVWSLDALDTNNAITGLDLLSVNDGWLSSAGSGASEIYRYNGTDWVLNTKIDNFFISDISAVSANEVWACGSAGSIFHFQNGSWSESPAPIPFSPAGRPANWLMAIDMYSATSGAISGLNYMLTYSNGIWTPQAMVKLSDPGNVSSLVSYCVMTDVDMIGESDGWAVGDCKEKDQSGNYIPFGGVYRLIDGIWIEQKRFANKLTSVSMANENKGWIVGDKCTIAMFNGSSWQIQECPIPEGHRLRNLKDNLQVVKAVDETEAWVLGRWGIKLYYNEEGVPSVQTSTPTPVQPKGFWLPFLR